MTELKQTEMVKQEHHNEQLERTRESRVYTPKVDIYEKNNIIYVLADIPGADETSVEVTLEKNILTIDARVIPERPENYSIHYAEYGIGDFHRRFSISDEIDREKITAGVRDGVLTLTLPKASPAVSKKISVRTE